MKLQEKIIKIWKKLMTCEEQNNEIKRIYSQVVKRFPYIKEEEITPAYDSFCGAGFPDGNIKSPAFFGGKELIVNMFFYRNYNPLEKEAIVAHELGHYGQQLNDEFLTREEELKNQIEADSRAAEAGYGEELIKLLKQYQRKTKSQESQEHYTARIKNLENKIY